MFEDKRIKVINTKRTRDGIIVACEKGIGLSIVTPDKKEYLVCVNLESSPIFKDEVEENGWNTKEKIEILRLLNSIFDRMVIEIENFGSIDLSRHSHLYFFTEKLQLQIGKGGGGNGESCPFGQ